MEVLGSVIGFIIGCIIGMVFLHPVLLFIDYVKRRIWMYRTRDQYKFDRLLKLGLYETAKIRYHHKLKLFVDRWY